MKKITSTILIILIILAPLVRAALPSVPANTTVSFPFSPNTVITSSEHNTNNTDLKTGINETKEYLRELDDHIFDISASNTILGTQTFSSSGIVVNGTTTLQNFSISSSGYTGTEFKINADNLSDPVFSCFSTGGGSSSGLLNPAVCFVPGASSYFGFYSQGISSSGLLGVKALSGT